MVKLKPQKYGRKWGIILFSWSFWLEARYENETWSHLWDVEALRHFVCLLTCQILVIPNILHCPVTDFVQYGSGWRWPYEKATTTGCHGRHTRLSRQGHQEYKYRSSASRDIGEIDSTSSLSIHKSSLNFFWALKRRPIQSWFRAFMGHANPFFQMFQVFDCAIISW